MEADVNRTGLLIKPFAGRIRSTSFWKAKYLS